MVVGAVVAELVVAPLVARLDWARGSTWTVVLASAFLVASAERLVGGRESGRAFVAKAATDAAGLRFAAVAFILSLGPVAAAVTAATTIVVAGFQTTEQLAFSGKSVFNHQRSSTFRTEFIGHAERYLVRGTRHAYSDVTG